MKAQVLNSALGMSPDQSKASPHSTAEIMGGGGGRGTGHLLYQAQDFVFLGTYKTINPLDYRTWLANLGATLLS